jgi:hypothetical protein
MEKGRKASLLTHRTLSNTKRLCVAVLKAGISMNLQNLLCFTLKTIDLLSSLLSFAHARLRVVSLA